MTRPTSWTLTLLGLGLCLSLTATSPSGAGRKFYDDDPISRAPETQDASGVKSWEIDLVFDLALNLFTRPGDRATNVRARDINTIDEVPDSSWFTNRILARPVTNEEAARGPLVGAEPAPGTWTVSRPKTAGFAPGFTMKDAKGETWFVSFDAKSEPEAATAAILVANKIFWTLGYWQVENYLITIKPAELVIAESAKVRPPSGIERRMKQGDLDAVLRRAARSADGTYRAVAGRAIPGRALGGFRYDGTRPDDPNDLVPHEHRRVLRALKVFGAFTNLVDMKAGNTLDTLVTADGRGVVHHYLQDVGSTFGTGANGPREYDEGWESLFDEDPTWKRLYTLGFYIQPWQTARYVKNEAIGRFEGTSFDPALWKPRVPTAAFWHARADDEFWAARRVMAFSDDMIRAIVKTGQYSDPAAEKLLADVLIQRRDKIGKSMLNAVNPLINFAMSAPGVLTFENAAIAAGVGSQPTGGYTVSWAQFDNNTGSVTPAGSPTTVSDLRAQAPSALSTAPGSYVKARIAAVNPSDTRAAVPVDVYFRRASNGWKLVGVERLP